MRFCSKGSKVVTVHDWKSVVNQEKGVITTAQLTAFSFMEYSNISFCCTRFLSQFTFIDICSSITTTNFFSFGRTFWTLT